MPATKAIEREYGDWLPGPRTSRFFNRTGTTLAVGALAMLDVTQSATETTTLRTGVEASVFANVILPTDAGVQQGWPVFVVLEETLDDKLGAMLVEGLVDVSVSDDDAASVTIDAGELVGFDETSSQSAVEGLDALERPLGLAFETAAASGSTGDAALKRVYWWGGNMGKSTAV